MVFLQEISIFEKRENSYEIFILNIMLSFLCLFVSGQKIFYCILKMPLFFCYTALEESLHKISKKLSFISYFKRGRLIMKKSNHLLDCFTSKEKNTQPTFITRQEM